jgi:hypothetical protein
MPTAEPGKEQGQTSGENKTTPAAGAELEVKLPEGTAIDEALLSGFKAKAGEAKLNSEQATAIATWWASEQKKQQDALVHGVQKQTEAWLTQIKSDPELGGAHFTDATSKARAAVVRFGGEKVRAVLNDYGLGNHPDLFRMFVDIGRSMAEDKAALGTAPGGLTPSTETERNRARYPNSK